MHHTTPRPRCAPRPHRALRPGALLLALALLGSLVACGSSEEEGAPVLRWYARDEAGGVFGAAISDCNEAAEGRYTIELVPLPANADEQREQLVRRLAAEDGDIDLMNMDVPWTAEFANAGWIEEWPEDRAAAVTEGRIETTVETATYDDALYGAPLNTNAQLLWYRDDLVDEVPATWDQMVDQAEALAEEGEPHIIWTQGQRYEGLVVWFVSLLASAGGSVLDESGEEVSLETEPTREALEVMRRYSRSVAAPSALATAQEDQGRQGWETGEAAFMTNYGFVWPSANQLAPDIAADMGWAQYPGVVEGEPSRVVIGGFNIGIGAYGSHQDLAFDAASCLVGEDNQIRNATDAGLLPVSEALYSDPALTEAEAAVEGEPIERDGEPVLAFPYAETIKAALDTAVLRPQTPYYNDVSLAIISILHPTADIDPDADVERLRDAISRALDGEGLL